MDVLAFLFGLIVIVVGGIYVWELRAVIFRFYVLIGWLVLAVYLGDTFWRQGHDNVAVIVWLLGVVGAALIAFI